MTEIIPINEPDKRNMQILEQMGNLSIIPVLKETEVGLANYTPLPLSRVTALGTGFQPLVSAIRSVTSEAGKSGLYYVNTNGKSMFQFKNGAGYLGSLQASNGMVGGGQAVLTPFACDPTMLFAAAALANIDKKLDTIQELQLELLDFLMQKERSELAGDLKFLDDVLNNYKYNWNSTMYKNSNHIKVLDIRQASERKIDFFREQIAAKVNKKSLIHSDQDVKKQMKKVQDVFKDYQLALYLFSFSSFLEVLLLENYDSSYLNEIVSKIEKYSLYYKELYTKCYNQLENYSKSSIQSTVLKGLAGASRAVGKAIEKVPVISNSQIDEKLIATGEKVSEHGKAKTEHTMQAFIESQANYVRPFVENIQSINSLYNTPVNFLIDGDTLYIGN